MVWVVMCEDDDVGEFIAAVFDTKDGARAFAKKYKDDNALTIYTIPLNTMVAKLIDNELMDWMGALEHEHHMCEDDRWC